MGQVLEQVHRDVISGARRGAGATVLRGVLRATEPFYAAAAAMRNRLFDRAVLASRAVPRPVISVGNITTGGTGKTPVVMWLVDSLRAAGHRPGVIMRGYKSALGQSGDEQRMLNQLLNVDCRPAVQVYADPDRLAAARQLLRVFPETDVIVLDDGFQHRRIRRDFDLVLIDAGKPFGFGHVLPRGLLREPLGGLKRADAFLITHADRIDPPEFDSLRQALARHNAAAPVYRCRHEHVGLRDVQGSAFPLSDLFGKRIVSFCGIGGPENFELSLGTCGAVLANTVRFADHHVYVPDDLRMLRRRAVEVGAVRLVTTEKDWVKVYPLLHLVEDLPPILRVALAIRFVEDDESRLMQQLNAMLASWRARAPRLP